LSFAEIRGVLALAGGWIARNAAVAGAPVLSTIEGTNLLYYRAAGALARERASRSRRLAPSSSAT
jgi:hypothetical protein